jgi:ABC-type multidrug transport system ATPase subunit
MEGASLDSSEPIPARGSSGQPAISVQGLRRTYGDTVALRRVSLELERGQTLTVLGPNGAGKTTLLRILAGLLRPTSGQVAVLGCSLPGEAWRIRSRIGYLGHQPLLYRELTLRENLRFHGRLFGLGDEGSERIEQLLHSVGLSRRADDRVRELSAGMVQRLAACRAILHSPELLLMDEPLAHVDPEAASALGPLIGPSADRTRVVVTHDVAAGLAEADQVLALARDGSVLTTGAADSYSEDELRATYAAGDAFPTDVGTARFPQLRQAQGPLIRRGFGSKRRAGR